MEYVSRMQHLQTSKCGKVSNVTLTLDNVTVTSTAAKFGGQSFKWSGIAARNSTVARGADPSVTP